MVLLHIKYLKDHFINISFINTLFELRKISHVHSLVIYVLCSDIFHVKILYVVVFINICFLIQCFNWLHTCTRLDIFCAVYFFLLRWKTGIFLDFKYFLYVVSYRGISQFLENECKISTLVFQLKTLEPYFLLDLSLVLCLYFGICRMLSDPLSLLPDKQIISLNWRNM